MKTHKLIMIGLASMAVSTFCLAQSAQSMGDIYETRCANCHGERAQGVPQLRPMPGVSAETADAQGMASEERANIYGPPLNYLSQEELVKKLVDLRNSDFDSASYHSVMQENLKTIEKREGTISDEMMAEYISKTFGEGDN